MLSKKFFIIQIFFLAAAVLLLMFYLRQPSPALGVYGQVGDFHLINSNSQTASLKDLQGKVWVADFFFTTCGNLCPMMNAHMSRLHELFKPYQDVRLVSFSVNPENDTPQALKAYAEKFHADTRRWIFLTGSREDITKVAVGSFKLGDIREPIFHSSYFILVDRKGQIRGYYDSTDSKNIEKIIKDLKQLIRENK
ncbi:MAG: SCO family protein [Candidatus Omnitrophica bacterium]|nr:SCO family protein [Candidatus Omnitrophota bacterium]